MRKRIITCLLSVCAGYCSMAQNVVSEQAVELLGGYTGDGYSAALGYVNYLSDRWLLRVDANGTLEEKYGLKHKAYGLDVYGGYTVKYFRFAEMYANVLFGLTGSFESGNFAGNETQFKTIKYGAMAGVELEKYFTNYWSVVACFNQRYVLNPTNEWGDRRWYAQLGIRFHIPKFGDE